MNYHKKANMRYDKLRHLVQHLKQTLPCTKCGKKFLYKNIKVIITTDDEGIFSLKCKSCGALTMANAGLETEREHHSIISKKDVSEMHDFLEDFNGDFKKIFKSYKPK